MRKTTKTFVSLLLVLCMIMPMATMVFAAGTADTASVYTGEKNNPDDWTKQDWIDNFAANKTNLTIDSAYELVTFAQASGSITFTDDTVVTVTTDIVLNEGDSKDWVLDQTGLFAFPGITNFVGTFNGNGKTVSGVYVKHSGTSNNSFDGFFKILASGTTTIKDYAIVNSYFTTSLSAYAATFICRINYTANVTLSGLYSNAIITHSTVTNNGTGGIVSIINANEGYTPTIKGCVFDGCIIAAGTVGGIVGLVANYQPYFSANITDCVNFGTFNGATKIGGILGSAQNLTINNCINYTGEALVGTMSSETISGDVNYVFAGQKVDGTGYYTGTATTISEANKGDGAYDLGLDFENTWAVRANDYPVPKAVYENFGKYFVSLEAPEYDDPNATVSVYTGFKNNADDWDAAAWKANYAAGGSYTIDSAYELMSFAKAGLTFQADATVMLTKDIVINQGNAESWIGTAPTVAWTPINNFKGTFDGQGHYVSGVYYEQAADMMGFFGKVTATTIKDFALINSYFVNKTTNGSWFLGGMVGRVNYGDITLTDCYTDAIVCGTGYSGGFIGLSSNRASSNNIAVIERCVFAGRVAGTKYNGGFVGLGQASQASNVVFKDCANIGTVVKGTASAGAFIPSLSDIYMSNCIDYTYTNMVSSSDGITTVSVSDCYLISELGQKAFVTTPTSGVTSVDATTVSINDIITDAETTLAALDFTNVWTVAENGIALPKSVYNNFKALMSLYNADVTVATGKYDVSDSEFEIATGAEFAAIAKLINIGKIATNGSGKTFKLVADITFNEGDAKYWATNAPALMLEPIKNFGGTFDGQGHTISGIYYTTTTEQFCSIFGILNANATVKNFAVLNSYLYFGKNYGGGVIGRINGVGVTVKGIYSEAIIDSNVGNGSGGIIGLISNTGTDSENPTYAVIEDCVFAGSVSNAGSGQAGGIVGQSANYQFCQAVIKNCANYGTVYGTTAGAIIGMTANVILDKCLNAGTVICANADNEIFFNDALIAAFGGSLDMSCVVNNCYNVSGNVICRPATYTKGTTEYAPPTVLTAEDKGTTIFAEGWTARENNYPLPTAVANIILDLPEIEVPHVHIWDNGVITTQPTHTAEGVKTFTCVCGETRTEAIEKLTEHAWDNGVITTQPTHTAEGVKTFTCVCGETRTEVIEKIREHTFGDWKKYDENRHVRSCACGEYEYADHEWDEGVKTLDPTYTTAGEMTYTCKNNCGATRVEGIPKLEYDEEMPQIIVSSKTITTGSTIQIPVVLSNNSGFAYLRVALEYNKSALTLESITNSVIELAMAHGSDLISWDGSSNYVGNGELCILTFKVAENAAAGDYEIKLTVSECYDETTDEVEFNTVKGTVTVIDFVYGDVNGDGEVNGKDVIILRQHLVGNSVEIFGGADANGDGDINGKDLIVLRCYLVGTSNLGPAEQ